MSWWGIVNPGAGRGRVTVDRVRTALAGADVAADLHVSDSEAHITDLVTRGLASGHRQLLVAGGDGTVNLVVNALMEAGAGTDVVLGVLPGGSGCDLVRTFGISQDVDEAAFHLRGSDEYTIDVGYVDGTWGRRHFANVASLGLGAAVVRHADRLPARLGASRYKLAVWPALAMFRKTPIKLRAGKRAHEGVASLIVLANAQFFGGGMNIAPKASMVDGELDVQVFTGPKRNAVVLQYRVNRGTHLTHKAVRRLSSGDIDIEIARPWEIEVDGEYLGSTDTVRAGVSGSAVRLKI